MLARAVALQGIGFGPALVAVQGFGPVAIASAGGPDRPARSFSAATERDDYTQALELATRRREVSKQNSMVIQFVMAAVISGALQ